MRHEEMRPGTLVIRYSTGETAIFLGRKDEWSILCNLLFRGRVVCWYSHWFRERED